MASDNRVPAELDCTNLAKEWPTWKRTFLMYMMANAKDEENEAKKIATFLWLIGPRAMDIYNTLFPNDGTTNGIIGNSSTSENVTPGSVLNSRTLENILIAFDQYCIPRKNSTMESFKFNNVVQRENQTFAEFETELRKQIQFCEFKCKCGASYEDRMLQDRIIIGVHDKKLQLKLLDGKDESLQSVINTCKVFESANAHKLLLDKSVCQSNVSTVAKQQASLKLIERKCYNCGEEYTSSHLRVCKANNATCRSCGRRGHFQKFCRSWGSKKETKLDSKTRYRKEDIRNRNPQVNINSSSYSKQLNWDDSGNVFELVDKNVNIYNKIDLSSRLISCASQVKRKMQWTKEYNIGNQKVVFKLDTGADVDCVPLKLVKKLNIRLKHEYNNFPIFDYNGNKVKTFGKVVLKCFDVNANTEHSSHFVVVSDDCEPILGLKSCIEFGLIKRLDVNIVACLPQEREEFLKSNRDVFEGLGKFPGTFSIKLKENAKPTLHYKKRIPLSLIDKLKTEIYKMVQDEIISPVEYPTKWVNNLQIVEKPNGKLRICLDPKPLNACIQREHFLIPTIDDFTSILANKRVFSVLDLSSGFWHMELDKSSSELTTFMTPFGRFKFNRVPFGLNCAPEMFQRKMVHIFGDIPGVVVYFDDVGIFAENNIEHDKILSMVIERARSNGIKFNPDKLQYRKSQVNFMGHMLSNGKIKSNNKYREAILKMKKPENKSDVMRLLGLLKYLAKYIPNLSKQSASLRNLTRNDVEFEWTEKHDKEMENLLNVIVSDPVLSVYDPKKPIIVQTDASKDGLGCVLLQNGHPIAYASRTLSKSEQKWAQIEKELLAIVFACQRFHYFLYGREFTVESDHKPLETLVKRDIDDVTARLQRMFMLLLKYPKMTVVYKPGKEMLVADCLSRAQLPDCTEIKKLSGIIHSVTKSACVSEHNYKLYLSIIERDEKYSRIRRYVENGWPSYHQLDDLSKKFYKFKSELHVENYLLFRDHRLVIPTELQTKISKWLHAPHFGIEKTLARARMHYYWPNMNSQIKEIVTSCAICEKFTRNQQKERLVQEEAPKYLFHIIAMDLFEYAGKDFLSIIDAYSGFIIVEHLNSKTSSHIIVKLKQNFNKLGYPTVIKCDNSPFGSGEFHKFASNYNIVIKFSSPRYPQSNGLAEKGVAIAKNILKRCYEAHETEHFQYRILEYNSTPVASMQLTPAQLFFGRMIKSRMPISHSLLLRNATNEKIVQQKIKEKREKQKYYYDRNAKTLPVLKEGDLVIFKKDSQTWNYGKVIENINNRSYIVRDNFNNFFRRNRRFIAKSKNNDFDASELLFEENIKRNVVKPNDFKEIQIVPPLGRDMINGNNPQNCNVEESILPVSDNGMSSSSDEYKTAGSNGSEAKSESEHETPEPITVNDSNVRRTRSGRIIRPPQRYSNS